MRVRLYFICNAFICDLLRHSESVDDDDGAEESNRARAKAANIAKEGELKREYEALLEQQRLRKQQEDEENERKLQEFLLADPELKHLAKGVNLPSATAADAPASTAAAEAAATAAAEQIQREQEEELKRRKEQEARDAEFARRLSREFEAQSKAKQKPAF